MLRFPDGTEVGVLSLNDVLDAVYREGRRVDHDTAEQIITRLAAKNYIVPSLRAQYRDVVMEEYRRYVEERRTRRPAETVTSPARACVGRATLLAVLLRRWWPGKRRGLRGDNPPD